MSDYTEPWYFACSRGLRTDCCHEGEGVFKQFAFSLERSAKHYVDNCLVSFECYARFYLGLHYETGVISV